MRKLLAFTLAFLMLPVEAFATAFGAKTVWDVRTTGVDTNGGGFDPGVVSPGTDESQGAGCAFTDLTLAGTGTTATSVTCPFSSTTHGPGNFLTITGGSGCTPGTYEELSQSAGIGTFNLAMGSAASVCTGTLGGPFVTVAKAGGLVVSGNTIAIKAGTYTTTAVTSIVAPASLVGYQTTHGDGGTKPLITTATNSTALFKMGTAGTICSQNLSLSNTATTRADGITWSANGSSP